MNQHEFWLALAYAKKYTDYAGRDIALMVNCGRKCNQIAVSVAFSDTATTTVTPVLMLLENLKGRWKTNYEIYTTAPPTEMCMGMARSSAQSSKGYIYYLADKGVSRFVTTTKGKKESGIEKLVAGNYPNIMDSSDKAKVDWMNTPAAAIEDIKRWYIQVTDPQKAEAENKAAKTVKQPAEVYNALPVPPVFDVSPGVDFLRLTNLIPDQDVRDGVFMMLAFEIVSRLFGARKKGQNVKRPIGTEGYNIGSLLTNAEGDILAWSVNTNLDNRTQHAETNLIQRFKLDEANPEAIIPANATLYTTLEPCEMCSGMIVRAAKNNPIRVVYGLRDFKVKGTALQLEKCPGNITMSSSAAIFIEPDRMRRDLAKKYESVAPSSATFHDEMKMAWKAFSKKSGKKKGYKGATGYLSESKTNTDFLGEARPHWFVYMWDYLTSQLKVQGKDKLSIAEQANDSFVRRTYQQLENTYDAIEYFMDGLSIGSA